MPAHTFRMAIEPSPARRTLAAAMLVGLGGMLVALAAAAEGAWGWRLLLVVAALGAFRLAAAIWSAASTGLVLDASGLREAGPDGRWIAPIEAVEAVERGPFAFKPSNGFLLTLRSPGPGAWAWAPGVWWRIGRRVGVGGVLRARDAKAASDALNVILLDRSPSRSVPRSDDG